MRRSVDDFWEPGSDGNPGLSVSDTVTVRIHWPMRGRKRLKSLLESACACIKIQTANLVSRMCNADDSVFCF